MIKSRGSNVIVRSQFNIGGSRGKSVKGFITDYVSRDEACDASLSYISPNGSLEQGDGVAFTLDNTSISRAETLRLADVVEGYLQEGNRAIQQMVISFAPEYLVEQGIVEADTEITKKGDYQYQYDDVRLRHAVRFGVQSMADAENYRDPQMVAAIQHDTLHLHVHVVVYENYPEVSRVRGREERGVIKPSSFNQLTDAIDRHLTMTKSSTIPNEKKMVPKKSQIVVQPMSPVKFDISQWVRYMEIFEELEQMREENDEQTRTHELESLEVEINLDNFMDNFYKENNADNQHN